MPMPLGLAPGYARLTYDGQLFPHHMVIPLNFDGTPVPGTEPSVLLKDSTSAIVTDALDPFFAALQPFFDENTHIGLCEIHTVDDVTGEDQFIFAFNVGRLGTSPETNVPTGQFVMTFKSTVGSLYKLYLMEGVQAPNNRYLPPFTDSVQDAMSDFLTGDASPVYARQNAYLFVPVSAISKYNDKLRKQQGLA